MSGKRQALAAGAGVRPLQHIDSGPVVGKEVQVGGGEIGQPVAQVAHLRKSRLSMVAPSPELDRRLWARHDRAPQFAGLGMAKRLAHRFVAGSRLLGSLHRTTAYCRQLQTH